MKITNSIQHAFDRILSESVKEGVEKGILVLSIVSYAIHLFIIFLGAQGVIEVNEKFFKDPIAAIYTPFSFILLYEVYLLIYFLPKSITIYIGKQYEIITLIVIRRIFKDIAYLELTSDWFKDQNDLQFTFDVFTSLILFFLIFQFYRNIKKKRYSSIHKDEENRKNIEKFVLLKKALAAVLIPVLVILASYTLIHWAVVSIQDYRSGILEFKQINNIFFDDFFTLLIVVDVLLLLFSFFYSDKFHKIIRNSGFVISTILLKVSLSSFGLVSNFLIIGAVLFGYVILMVHNLFDEKITTEDETDT
jgi:hypothetical protein